MRWAAHLVARPQQRRQVPSFLARCRCPGALPRPERLQPPCRAARLICALGASFATPRVAQLLRRGEYRASALPPARRRRVFPSRSAPPPPFSAPQLPLPLRQLPCTARRTRAPLLTGQRLAAPPARRCGRLGQIAFCAKWAAAAAAERAVRARHWVRLDPLPLLTSLPTCFPPLVQLQRAAAAAAVGGVGAAGRRTRWLLRPPLMLSVGVLRPVAARWPAFPGGVARPRSVTLQQPQAGPPRPPWRRP